MGLISINLNYYCYINLIELKQWKVSKTNNKTTIKYM